MCKWDSQALVYKQESRNLNFLFLVGKLVLVIKNYSTLGKRYWDLQARVYKQKTKNKKQEI